MSVEEGGKDVGGVTLPILKVGRPFAVKREFIVSKVPSTSLFLTVAISTLIFFLGSEETLFFSSIHSLTSALESI